MMKWRTAIILGPVFCALTSACSASGPAVPSVDEAPDRIVGVMWFDDGNGEIDGNERAVQSARVQVGVGTRVMAVMPADTNERGGFVIDLPATGEPDRARLDTFVQVTLQVKGPGETPTDVHFRQSFELNGPDVLVPVPAVERCPAPIEAATTSEAGCGRLLLPDLVPLVEDFGQPPTQPVAEASASIDLDTLPGVPLLRFASATANVGAGPLHMIPDYDPDVGRIPTWQRLWTDENRFIDHETGEFVFHREHDHFHVEGFERYQLLNLEGETVGVSRKVSFCLIDSLQATSAAKTRGVGVFPDAICEDARDQQALNAGWADYYGAGLADQWIELTGIMPGDYLVEITVDPDNILIESDETNNTAVFPVKITEDELRPDDR